MNTDSLYSFVFRGMLTDEALDKTERIKKSKVSDADFASLCSSLGIDDLDEELVLQAKKMSIVYTAICAFENSVRLFVSKNLHETVGEDWWNRCVSEKSGKNPKLEGRKKVRSGGTLHELIQLLTILNLGTF